jgi:hypothetical protein
MTTTTPQPPPPTPAPAAKVWTRQDVIDLIATSNVAVEKALVKLYERQTAAEQDDQHTHDRNGRGFGSFDAEILSSFASRVIVRAKQGKPAGERLTPGELGVCRKPIGKAGTPRLGKYAGQLLDEIEASGKPVNRKAA